MMLNADFLKHVYIESQHIRYRVVKIPKKHALMAFKFGSAFGTL